MDNEIPTVNVDKITEKSRQWTLDGDCTLLQWMDQISNNLVERAMKSSCDLNELTIKLDRTSVALSNATNNLACLQYSRFVENRVHDDDETLANVTEVPSLSTDVTDNTVVKQDMYTFLKKNLEMMNSCHEPYSITYNDSDDDDDEPNTNVVYRSTNPYETRSLPHIYGSELWKEKWHIGLCDSDNDFSGDEISEQFSESSSTDDSYESTAPTMSEWDSAAWGLNTNHLAERKDIRTSSNDGESLNQGENSSHMDIPVPKNQVNQSTANPLPDPRYYQHIPRREENLFDDIFSEVERPTATQVIIPAQKPVNNTSLIANEPPPIDQPIENASSRQVGARKPLNLFDDDEFSSFMDQIVQTATSKNIQNAKPSEEKVERVEKKVIPNIFNDSEDLFAKKAHTSSVENTQILKPPAEGIERVEKKVLPNIFDDSEDLFTQKAHASPVATVKRKDALPKLEDDIFMPPPLSAVTKNRTRNLFDDDDEDDDFESIFAKKPSTSNKFTQNTKNLFDDDLGDMPVETKSDSLLLENEGKTSEAVKVTPVKEAVVKTVQLISKSLFDDDEEDLEINEENLFSKPVKKVVFVDSTSQQEEVSVNDTGIKINKIFSNGEESKENKADWNSNATSVLRTDIFADPIREEPPKDDMVPTNFIQKKTKIADIFAEHFTDDFEEFIPKSLKNNTEDPPPVGKISPVDITQHSPKKSYEEIKHNTQQVSKPVETMQVEKNQNDMTEDASQASKISSVDVAQPNPNTSLEEIKHYTEKNKEHMTTDIVASEDSKEEAVSNSTFVPEDTDNLPGLSEKQEHLDVISEPEEHETIVPNYTSLFNDEPPPDNEDPFEFPYKDTVKCDADGKETVSTPQVAPYSSINLFADVPPDDDFQIVPPLETKRIHSIFYDDFNETIEASREMRAPSNYIFNDEPPPDDEVPTTSANCNNKPRVFEENKDKPKVSKLKKNDLQINVGALLPTAKIPSFKKPESVSAPPKGVNDPIEIIAPKSPAKRDLPESVLPNLNRNRPKMQVKRRPSTRKGRQESYRKSMMEDDLAEAKLEQDDSDENSKEPISENIARTERNPSQISLRKEAFDATSRVIQSVEQSFEPPPSLFENSGNNIFDALRSDKNRPNEPTPEFTPVAKVLDSIINSIGADEDISDSSIKAFHKPATVEPMRTKPITETPGQTLTKINPTPAAAASLFDDDDAVVASSSSKPAFKVPKENPKQSSKPVSLFGESDDGSDDLFGEIKIPKKSAPQKVVEKKTFKPKAVDKPAKPTGSLFSSDEESGSGDDIFGKPKSKVTKKVVQAKSKPSKSLFEDLSDDVDDLFETSKKKPSGVDKSKSKPPTSGPQATKISAIKPQQTAISNNPLADLLDP